MADPILGWKLDANDRAALLARFPPRYERTVADHVTHGRKGEAPPISPATSATVVGHADDAQGVEALVVEVAGQRQRWDGGVHHITWSLGRGREAKESNEVIARLSWRPLEGVDPVGLTPAEWP